MILALTMAVLVQSERKLDDYKTLLENNVFSPPKAAVKAKPPEPKKDEPKPAEPSKPDPVLVTGFARDPALGAYEAVIEDRKKKEIRFVKAGDVVEGWTIVAIEQGRMVVRKEGGEREFHVGEALVGDAPPPPPDEKTMLGEADVDPKKVEEARQRRREKLGKKAMEEEGDEAPPEKRNKKRD